MLLAAAGSDEAHDYYDKALSLDEGIEAAERAEILFRRGLASRALGRWDAAAADWKEALPALESGGKADLVTRICWELAYQALWHDQRDEAKVLATRGLESAGNEPSAGRCRLLAMLGHVNFLNCNFDHGDELLSEALAMAEALGDERLLAGEVLLHRMYYCEHTLKPLKMAEVGERLIELARRSGRPWDISSSVGVSIIAWCFRSQFDRAQNAADEAERLARQEGDLGTLGHAMAGRALADLARGDLTAARDSLDKAIQVWQGAGIPWAFSWRRLKLRPCSNSGSEPLPSIRSCVS